MKVVTDDFLLLNSHVITDLDLNEAMSRYEELNKRENGVIMMKLFYKNQRKQL